MRSVQRLKFAVSGATARDNNFENCLSNRILPFAPSPPLCFIERRSPDSVRVYFIVAMANNEVDTFLGTVLHRKPASPLSVCQYGVPYARQCAISLRFHRTHVQHSACTAPVPLDFVQVFVLNISSF